MHSTYALDPQRLHSKSSLQSHGPCKEFLHQHVPTTEEQPIAVSRLCALPGLSPALRASPKFKPLVAPALALQCLSG